MKAIRIPAMGEMEVVQLPEPQPQTGEVKIRLHYVGFCGSDLNTFRGGNAMAKPQVIPGHEIGATTEALGRSLLVAPVDHAIFTSEEKRWNEGTYDWTKPAETSVYLPAGAKIQHPSTT